MIFSSKVTVKEIGRSNPMSPSEETNPLQKYVEALDNPTVYTPPLNNSTQAQYLIKALDYLKIWSQEHDDVVEQPLHDQVEEMLVDIVALVPEDR